ncbi:MAG: hypothetical protein J3T61_09590 [Candidatus Brocadiales bacterium]|nr:hypothetical protein [Candidatus Bathyanammoxibius sp.]
MGIFDGKYREKKTMRFDRRSEAESFLPNLVGFPDAEILDCGAWYEVLPDPNYRAARLLTNCTIGAPVDDPLFFSDLGN